MTYFFWVAEEHVIETKQNTKPLFTLVLNNMF